MSEPELVRVRTKTGYETTVSRVHAEASDDLTILDESPGEVFGRSRPIARKGGRPILPPTSVDAEVTKSQAAKPAADKKG